MMKKILRAGICLLLCLVTALPAFAAAEGSLDRFTEQGGRGNYTDVPRRSWYYQTVQAVSRVGLMEGDKGRFYPDGTLTVAEAVTVAARFHSIYTDGDLQPYLKSKPWYKGYFTYLADNMNLPRGLYEKAQKNADRATVFALLAQIIDPKDAAQINIMYEIPDYNGSAADKILTLYRAGILTGSDSQGRMLPDSNIKRCELAAILGRMVYPKLRKKTYFAPRCAGDFDHFTDQRVYSNNFSDVRKSDWFYKNVRECYQKGIMSGVSAGRFDTTSTVCLNEAAAIAARLHNTYTLGSTDYLESFPKGKNWWDKYFDYLESLGVQLPGGRQSAERPLTRAQTVALLSAVLGNDALKDINHISQIPDYIGGGDVLAAKRFYNAGITRGQDGYGTFAPMQKITRSELAAMTSRLVNAALRQKFTLQAPPRVSTFVYGVSGAGRALTGTRIGNGKNVLVLGFAIHGWEDHFARDGQELVNTAEALIKDLKGSKSLTDGWTVYVLPLLNPDGLYDGNSCNGSGRCTVYSYNQNGEKVKRGIDLNRCFPSGFTRYTGARNYNGSTPMAASEAQAIDGFLRAVHGTRRNIFIDVHGWYNQIITQNPSGFLSQAFKSQFPQTRPSTTQGKGYLMRYAYEELGYESALFEFPADVNSHADFVRRGYQTKFIGSIHYILKNGK